MARIPVYEQRTAPGGLGVSARATPAQVDQSMGRAIQNAGQTLGGIAKDYQRQQEQTMEDRAALEAANALSKGEAYWHEQTTTRSQGWKPGDPDLRESVGKDYEKWVSETTAALPTERARLYFQTQAGSMRSRMDRGLFDYQERRTVDMLLQSTQEGIDADVQTVFGNPDLAPTVLARRLAVIDAQTRIPADKKLEIGRKLKEQISLSAVMGERARNGDTAFFGSIVAPVPKGEEKPGQAPAAAPAAPPAFETLFGAVVKQESGGVHRKKDGSLLTSPAGAAGITQVMPKTGVDPGYGIKPLQNDSEEEYLRFGRDYLKAMLTEFNGDTAKALAAYNAGPGRVQQLVAKHGDNWLAHAPKETQDYVASITSRAGGGSAAVAPQSPPITVDGVQYVMRPPEQLPSAFRGLPVQDQFRLMQEAARGMEQEKKGMQAGVALTAARSVVDMLHVTPDTVVDLPEAKAVAVRQAERDLGPLKPEQRLQVENAVEKMVADKERDAKRADAASLTSVFDILDRNGGDWNAAMAANPKLIGGLSRDARERASQYAGAVATGATRETDWQVYTGLVNDPALLRATNIDALRDKLNVKEFVQLKKAQDALMNDSTAEQDIRSNLTIVKELLEQNKVTDEKKQAQFFSLLQQGIDSELAATGKKKLTQPEIKKKAAELLTEVVTSRGIFWDSKERAFNLEIPPLERSKIEAALIAEGLPVNDYYVNRAYRKKLERQNIPAPVAKN